MRICITNARGKLAELIRRAKEGDEIVLTRHGQAVARIVPVNSSALPTGRGAIPDSLNAKSIDAM